MRATCERAGYETRVADRRRRGALERRRARAPDLVVLDLMLPGVDGLEVMRRIRARGPAGARAIILLTAAGEESDRIVGLRLGADDYVVKPFSPGRARRARRRGAAARRHRPPSSSRRCASAGSRSTRADGACALDGEDVALTQREFDLLLFLARHPGQVFTRNQLMDHVWRYSFYTDTSTVTVHIRRLRAKIERDPEHPRWIETVWGVGYRFAP